ncbi:MAG: hypothetical protein B7X99_03735, partial [Rhizobiales bacterium 17-65-6]
TAPSRAGIDGGMHPVFLAKFKELAPTHQDGQIVVAGPAPGTIPSTTRPPAVADDGFSPVGYGSGTATLLAAAQSGAPAAAGTRPAGTAATGGFSLGPALGFNTSGAAPQRPAETAPAAGTVQQTASLTSSGTTQPPATVAGGNTILSPNGFLATR